LEYITEYGLSVKNFIAIISLLLPNLLIITTPLSLFLSVTFAYAKLVKNNEIVILQSVGVKKSQLTKPVIYLNVIATVLLCLNVMFFIPQTNKKSDNMKEIMKNDIVNLMFKNGNFDSIKNITFYANTNEQQKLENLMLYIKSADGEKKDRLIYSKTAEINGIYITLHDGNIQEFKPEDKNENSALFFKEYSLNLGDYYKMDAKKEDSRDMDVLNIFELFKLRKNKEINNEIIRRIINSIIGLFLSILACCLILNKKFSRMESELEIAKIYSICALLFIIFVYLVKNNIYYKLLLLYTATLFTLDLILIGKKNEL
jgi:lipopolysaccharide export LptBFGC system permease protein LptF